MTPTENNKATGRGRKVPTGQTSTETKGKPKMSAAARRAQDVEEYLAHQRGRREWSEETETEKQIKEGGANNNNTNETVELSSPTGVVSGAGETAATSATDRSLSTHTQAPPSRGRLKRTRVVKPTEVFTQDKRAKIDEPVEPGTILEGLTLPLEPQAASQGTEHSTEDDSDGTIGAMVNSTTVQSSGRGVKRTRVVNPDGAFTTEKRRRSG
jgi:hypothetical protein